MADPVAELQSRFGIANVASFERSPSGLIRLNITSERCEAELYLHGAHLTHFQPAGQRPVLFLSRWSNFAPETAIRGGVPICFPWFGPHAQLRSAPQHGVARVQSWQFESLSRDSGGAVVATLSLESNEISKRFFPHDFVARFSASFGSTLQMTLEIRNPSRQAYRFEEALHTYLAVDDVTQVAISGLEHVEYFDKVHGGQRVRQGSGPIRFAGELDRVYIDTPAACALHDPLARRRIVVEKSNSLTTVVWNPGSAKVHTLKDMEPAAWQHMACIETANAGPNAVSLPPGASHAMQARVRVEAL